MRISVECTLQFKSLGSIFIFRKDAIN